MANESDEVSDLVPDEPKPTASSMPVLKQLGDYRIIRLVGQGGMGAVYEAEQVSLGRHVALKILPQRLLADAKQKRRFAREARAAARLHHTHIVPVFGVGEQDGMPYYVMQFIQGLGLDRVLVELQRLQAGKSPAEEATRDSNDAAGDLARSLLTGAIQQTLELPPKLQEASTGTAADRGQKNASPGPPRSDSFVLSSSSLTVPGARTPAQTKQLTYWQSVARIGVQVADALAYAHLQGIIHRDIKPSNLLLDTRNNIWVTDFGLAKADDQENLTHSGDVLGTLRYMPPEAFEAKTDPRSDIYSLGLTLYELLALRPAFKGRDRNQLIKQVTQTEPPRLNRLNSDIPRDLVTIVHKAIDREPARRYSSAVDLHGDLQRFLDDEPIRARRTSALERLLRWARHNRGLAASLAVITLLLIAGLVGLTIATARFHDQALVQTSLAKEKEDERRDADAARRKLALTLSDMHTSQGLRAGERGNPAQAVLWFASAARLAEGDPERERLNRVRVRTWSRLAFAPVHGLRRPGPGEKIQNLVFHPDGQFLLVSEEMGWQNGGELARCTIWDLERERPLPGPSAVASSAAWSPDGKWLALGSSAGGVQLARFPGGDAGERIVFPEPVRRLVFSPNGRLLAIAGRFTVQVWDCQAHAFANRGFRHPALVDTIVFNPGSDRVATGTRDGGARVFDVFPPTEPPPFNKPLGPPGQPRFAAVPHARWDTGVYGTHPVAPLFVADGRELVTCTGQSLTWWNAETGDKIFSVSVFDGPFGSWNGAVLSSDGKYLAVACGLMSQGKLRILEAGTGQAISPVLPYRNTVAALAFSPDCRLLLAGSTDRMVGLWAVPSGATAAPPLVHAESVHMVAFSADGKLVATGQEGGQVSVWGLPAGKLRGYRLPLDGRYSFASLSPGGNRLLPSGMSNAGCTLQSTRVYDLATGLPDGPVLRPGGILLNAAFAPDGKHVALLTGRMALPLSFLQVLDWQTGKPAIKAVLLPSEGRCLDYSPDGERLAVICAAGQLLQIDPRRGELTNQWTVRPPANNASHYVHGNGAVRFGPDGKTLWIWGTEPTVRVLDSGTGIQRFTLVHGNTCHDVEFSRGGRYVATASFGKTANVWEYATGRAVAATMVHPDWVFAAVFSPDGETLLTTCRDGMARVWDWKRGRLLSPPMAHSDEVHPAAFTPDGRWVVTASIDQTARVWDWRTGVPVSPPLPVGGKALSVVITPDNNHAVIGGFGTNLEVIRLGILYEQDHESLEDLSVWGELLSGQRVHEGGGVTNLTGVEWLQRWQAYRRRHPDQQ
jgi:serine/threonine protein kinase/WD40 repeat protein